MSNSLLLPHTPAEVQDIVRQEKQLLPVGGGTKPALSRADAGVTAVSLQHLQGIIEYDPGEFTFTAYAGTPVNEVAAVLAEHGQYLPFDPLLAAQGATLGGTIAANTSGSGRFRYGGVRDFILGIRFVDGYGRVVRGGGKVVKNAAGFDLPKFFVGSMGRYGILTEVTFKVFPAPAATVTLQSTSASLADALETTFLLANQPFEMLAQDIHPRADGSAELRLRLGGLPAALPDRVTRLVAFLAASTPAGETAVRWEDTNLWANSNAFVWADPALALVKVPLAPRLVPLLDAGLGGNGRVYTAAANIAWVTTADLPALSTHLTQLGLAGLVLRGGTPPIIGKQSGAALARRVKQALDPHGKFLEA